MLVGSSMVQWEEQVLEPKGPRFKFFEPLSLFLCRNRENTRATVLSDWKKAPSVGLIKGHDYSKYAVVLHPILPMDTWPQVTMKHHFP